MHSMYILQELTPNKFKGKHLCYLAYEFALSDLSQHSRMFPNDIQNSMAHAYNSIGAFYAGAQHNHLHQISFGIPVSQLRCYALCAQCFMNAGGFVIADTWKSLRSRSQWQNIT